MVVGSTSNTFRIVGTKFCIKMCENNLICALYVVEFCSDIITNVSNNVQTGEIHKFTQCDGAFHLVVCRCNFRHRG